MAFFSRIREDIAAARAHDPAARGSGAAEALLTALSAIGSARGWTVIRWITADDNYRARGLYDRLADRTKWITYDIRL